MSLFNSIESLSSHITYKINQKSHLIFYSKPLVNAKNGQKIKLEFK